MNKICKKFLDILYGMILLCCAKCIAGLGATSLHSTKILACSTTLPRNRTLGNTMQLQTRMKWRKGRSGMRVGEKGQDEISREEGNRWCRAGMGSLEFTTNQTSLTDFTFLLIEVFSVNWGDVSFGTITHDHFKQFRWSSRFADSIWQNNLTLTMIEIITMNFKQRQF